MFHARLSNIDYLKASIMRAKSIRFF